MKKTILALLVLLTAALVFTGCPKEPDMPKEPETVNLDGTWVCKWDIPSMTVEGITIPAFTMDAIKLVVSGNTYKIYMADFDALFGTLEDWMTDGNPPTTWDPEVMDEGTYTLSGNTVTCSGGETLTLSADKKELTMANPDYDPENPNPFDGPETFTFKKQ